MKIPNARQMKELDAYTIQNEKINSLDLMERAAREVALFINHSYDTAKPITIFAGPGNNGGDGLAVARLLSQKGFQNVSVFLFNTNNSLSDDCKANAERLKEDCPNVSFTEVQQQFEAPKLESDTLVIDALFGTGISRPLSGGFAALIKFINGVGAEVISIDMPSGLMCEDNTLNSPSAIIKAHITITIGLPKLSLLLADNQQFVGQLHVAHIPMAYEEIDETEVNYSITECWEAMNMLKERSTFGHKGTFGNALLIAGRYGMAGAAVLTAKACLRMGVGKVTIHTPRLNNDILQIAIPEAILLHDESERIFTTPVKSYNFQATAIGPGIGTDKRTALAFIEQASHTSCPLVIDADGINILGDHKGWISQIPPYTIFTPHPKEMQRLGICNADSYSTLLEATNMAKLHKFFIILKGHYTAVCCPDGKVYFNPTGNSGMATAGSGDVLTGIILALIAQGYSQETACRLGVYLHGLAGDIAAEQLTEYSITASDLIVYLPHAIKELQKNRGGAQDIAAKGIFTIKEIGTNRIYH